MWEIVQRITSLATVFLLIVMLSLITADSKTSIDKGNILVKIEQSKEEFRKVMANNIEYVEKRINRLAENQDNYQNATSKELSLLKARVNILEEENKTLKNQAKIVNNNNSNAVVNLPSLQ